jgi:hypothetical protein
MISIEPQDRSPRCCDEGMDVRIADDSIAVSGKTDLGKRPCRLHSVRVRRLNWKISQSTSHEQLLENYIFGMTC